MKKTILLGLLTFAVSALFSQEDHLKRNIRKTKKVTEVQTQIDVEYKPIDNSGLNWDAELENARVIPTLDQKSIRITLPNQDTANVVITDIKGKKVFKKCSYVSPAAIDISKLRKGEYQLIIEMHNITKVKTFSKKSK